MPNAVNVKKFIFAQISDCNIINPINRQQTYERLPLQIQNINKEKKGVIPTAHSQSQSKLEVVSLCSIHYSIALTSMC